MGIIKIQFGHCVGKYNSLYFCAGIGPLQLGVVLVFYYSIVCSHRDTSKTLPTRPWLLLTWWRHTAVSAIYRRLQGQQDHRTTSTCLRHLLLPPRLILASTPLMVNVVKILAWGLLYNTNGWWEIVILVRGFWYSFSTHMRQMYPIF